MTMILEPKTEVSAAELELRSVAKSFRNGRKDELVLSDISLTVGRGEFVSIIGPSGSGKTTLFHIIGGLIAPSSGQVLLRGQDVTGETGRISYMPQNAALFPWRTVIDNVILAQEIAGAPKKSAREEAREWLVKVGLGGYEDAYPNMLSGGMQQRVAFLRALLSPHELMCLDEPFGALDALTRLDMQRWLLNIWEETKRSVLFVTHSIEEAILLSDMVVVLSDKPAKVLKQFVIPFARPRLEEVTAEPAFLELKQEIYQLLRKC